MWAPAKINLALVVGLRRPDGRHEVATILQRVGLSDRIELEENIGNGISIEGFAEDTLVRAALTALGEAAGIAPRWRVRLEKNIPVAGGLGGGSADAAAALRQANASLAEPLPPERLVALAASLGADIPFFLADGAQLGTGDGSQLSPLDLPRDYVVLVVLPGDAVKESTAAVYDAFDRRRGAEGFDVRRAALFDAVRAVRRAPDLALLPKNDLASSPLAGELERLGAFRADVSGAGPAVYALFGSKESAARAGEQLREATTWVIDPVA